MGNAFSNPLDENKQARMNEIINEVVAVFAKVLLVISSVIIIIIIIIIIILSLHTNSPLLFASDSFFLNCLSSCL